MSFYNMQFIHRALVQVKIGGASVSLYPTPNALMLAAERAHGFHVTKNNLLAANLAPCQVLSALGQQTGQGTVVDGKIAGFLRHFGDHWRDFRNLTILGWHNSAGAIIPNTATAADSSILMPVQDGNSNAFRQQDI